MNLYLKQKVFSWSDKFTVYDENAEDVFYVQGELFSFGKKLHILGLNGDELCFIHQKVFSFLPRYYISKNSVDIAEVKKEITFFHQVYTVSGFDWEVEGDFWAHEYQIKCAGGVVANISKKWLTWGDAYEISIDDRFNPVDVLAVVLVIDACLAASQNSGI